MATNKEMVIKVTADTSQVDSAIKQVGELRAVTEGSPIMIQYDVDGKPLDIVLEKSVNLRTESKLLFNELQKLTKEGKTQSAEFGLLSSKYNDTKSSLAAVDARSRDLFASLSLIPGPIGDIAGKLNGAIGLLKTFSSFSLKDVGNQIKGLNNDIGDVFKNLLGLNKEAAKTAETTNARGAAGGAAGAGAQAAGTAGAQAVGAGAAAGSTVGTTANTAAIIANNQAVSQNIKLLEVKELRIIKDGVTTTLDTAIVNANTGAMLANVNALVAEGKVAINAAGEVSVLTGAFRQLSAAEIQAIATGETLVITNKTITTTTEVASTATKGFMASLRALASATGFLALIAIIGAAVYGLYKYISALEDATDEQKQFNSVNAKAAELGNENISTLNKLMVTVKQSGLTQREKNAAVNEYNEKLGETLGKVRTYDELEKKLITNGPSYVAYLKIKSQAEAAYALSVEKTKEALIKGAEDPSESANWMDRLSGIFESKNYGETVRKQGAVNRDIRKKEIQKESEAYFGLFEKFQKDAVALAEKLKLPVPQIKLDKTEAVKKKEEIKNDNKEYDRLMQEYRDNNRAKVIQDERKRQDEELKIKKQGEERLIKALELTDTIIYTELGPKTLTKEQKLKNLLKEVQEKYALEVLEINQKRADEDLKLMQADAEKALKIREDFIKKMISILDDSYESETMRAKAARETKYNDDKAALEKDLEAVKASEEEKAKLLLALKVAFDRDIKKIDDDKKQKDADDRIKKLDEELRFLEMNAESSKNSFTEYWKVREQILDKSKARELAATDLTEKQKTDIEKKYANLSKQLQKEKFDAYVGYLNQGLSALQTITSQQIAITNAKRDLDLDDLQLAFNARQETNAKEAKSKEDFDKQTSINQRVLLEDQDKVKEKYFYKNRDAQYAQAMISAFQAAISAYASLAVIPVVGPVLGAAAAAAALVFGVKQANLIKQQTYVSAVTAENPYDNAAGGDTINRGKNYADGGMIEGPRHSSPQGGVPIMAEGGEAVMTRGAVTMFKPLLSMMNQAGGGTSFTPGAVGAAKFDNPKTDTNPMEQPIIKTFVVESDLTTMQHKQARLKSLSTL